MKSANSTSGCPKKPIWRFFEQGDEIDKEHYIATCLACKQTFHPGKTPVMEKHIMNNYLKVDHSIREAVIYMVEARKIHKISSGANTKRQNSELDQVTLENFYENSDLSKKRKEDIDTALIKAFVIGENSILLRIPDENENVRFRQHAIKSFNKHFKMYDFDEPFLVYYIHPSYKESMSKIHSYYIANSKSELPNFSKDRTAEKLRTILSDTHLCDDDDEYVDDYNKEIMIKLVSSPPINDDCE
ncbi:hypothetical protein C1646_676107 [Rhizophagus diaphanus]|nr:hypothetical protein C1646_676107 [Rhizophagus diaphanus] [Rhizophagus sp. MUCL 43196]